MYTKQVNIYQFNELPEAAKEAARDWFRSCPDSFDDDSVKEEYTTAGDMLGITIDEILCSGFAVQGDGACFTGSYAYASGWREALKSEFGAGLLAKFEGIGERLEQIQGANDYAVTAKITHSDRYTHALSADIEVLTDHGDDDAPESVSQALKEVLQDFMQMIYRSLEDEHDGQMSAPAIDETLEINKYTFNEKGQRES